jgi:hypothetical protein
VLYLASLNEISHRAGDVFDRNDRVHAMLIKEIDRFDLQPPRPLKGASATPTTFSFTNGP